MSKVVVVAFFFSEDRWRPSRNDHIDLRTN
jgi:hypothetical protein